ncbi:hypothetical protein LTR02_017448, partial [Friedmanniomyces endolithicus]
IKQVAQANTGQLKVTIEAGEAHAIHQVTQCLRSGRVQTESSHWQKNTATMKRRGPRLAAVSKVSRRKCDANANDQVRRLICGTKLIGWTVEEGLDRRRETFVSHNGFRGKRSLTDV